MQSAAALAGWACTEMKAHPVGELRLLGKPRRLNELCFCAAFNCRFQVEVAKDDLPPELVVYNPDPG